MHDQPIQDDLLQRHLTGEANEAEELQVAAWRSYSPSNEEAYQLHVKHWNQYDMERPVPEFDVQNGWERLTQRLELDPQSQTEVVPMTPKRGPGPFWKGFLGLAAAAAVTLVFLGLWFMDRDRLGTVTERLATGTMAQRNAVLPDGTEVTLNAGSSLTFPREFGDQREVHLTGQAFFKVVKNQVPFVVHTEQARVAVLGTEFDVWARNQKTRVVVRQGSVALASLDGTGKVILKPGQMSTCITGGKPTPVEAADAGALMGWLDGKLVFRKQSLGDVIADLHHTYGVSIKLESEDLASKSLTASFSGEKIETVLDELCLALNLRYRLVENTYLIEN